MTIILLSGRFQQKQFWKDYLISFCPLVLKKNFLKDFQFSLFDAVVLNFSHFDQELLCLIWSNLDMILLGWSSSKIESDDLACYLKWPSRLKLTENWKSLRKWQSIMRNTNVSFQSCQEKMMRYVCDSTSFSFYIFSGLDFVLLCINITKLYNYVYTEVFSSFVFLIIDCHHFNNTILCLIIHKQIKLSNIFTHILLAETPELKVQVILAHHYLMQSSLTWMLVISRDTSNVSR
jgi:hypothetical protein